MGLGAVPRGRHGVMVSVVDVGPAAGPGWPGRAQGPLVVERGIAVVRPILIIERAIAEGRREDERIGVGVGLLAGVADPVGDAGLLGDVALVGGGGVVVLCHGEGDGKASGFD